MRRHDLDWISLIAGIVFFLQLAVRRNADRDQAHDVQIELQSGLLRADQIDRKSVV